MRSNHGRTETVEVKWEKLKRCYAKVNWDVAWNKKQKQKRLDWVLSFETI